MSEDFIRNPTYTDFKESVKAASTASVNIDLAPASIDGVSLVFGDTVLLKDQGIPANNGVYMFGEVNTPMERAPGSKEVQLSSGMIVIVEQGTVNADKVFMLTTDEPINPNVTPLTFEEFGGGGGGGGVQLSDNNVWTGTNDFQSDVTVADSTVLNIRGQSGYGSTTQGLSFIDNSDAVRGHIHVRNDGGGGGIQFQGPIRFDGGLKRFIDTTLFSGTLGFAGTDAFDGAGFASGGTGITTVYGQLRQNGELPPVNDEDLANKKYVDDNAGGGSSSTFVYDQNVAAHDNSYDDFDLMLAAMVGVEGRKDVYMKSAWFPAAAFYNLDDIHFHGDPNRLDPYVIYIEPGFNTTFSMNRGGLHSAFIYANQSDQSVVWTPIDPISEFEITGSSGIVGGGGVQPYFIELTGSTRLELRLYDATLLSNYVVNISSALAELVVTLHDIAQVGPDVVAGVGTLTINGLGVISDTAAQSNFTGTLDLNPVLFSAANTWTGTYNIFNHQVNADEGIVLKSILDIREVTLASAVLETSNTLIDPFNYFIVEGSGKMLWGDGTNPADTVLYRTNVNELSTLGDFIVDGAFTVTQTVDISDSLTFSNDSAYLHFGGTGIIEVVGDFNVAGQIKTDGDFIVGGQLEFTSDFPEINMQAMDTASSEVFQSKELLDSDPRFLFRGDGKLEWGDGTNPADTNLYRSGIGQLTTDGTINLGTAFESRVGPISARFGDGVDFATVGPGEFTASKTGFGAVFSADVIGDVQDRFKISVDGLIEWGVGSGATDTNLYRFDVNKLKTDGSLIVTEALQVEGNAFIGDAPTDTLGFYGATAVAQQAAPVTLADVITVLQNLGLTA